MSGAGEPTPLTAIGSERSLGAVKLPPLPGGILTVSGESPLAALRSSRSSALVAGPDGEASQPGVTTDPTLSEAVTAAAQVAASSFRKNSSSRAAASLPPDSPETTSPGGGHAGLASAHGTDLTSLAEATEGDPTATNGGSSGVGGGGDGGGDSGGGGAVSTAETGGSMVAAAAGVIATEALGGAGDREGAPGDLGVGSGNAMDNGNGDSPSLGPLEHADGEGGGGDSGGDSGGNGEGGGDGGDSGGDGAAAALGLVLSPNSSDDVEVQELAESAGFRKAQAQDPTFTLLHWVSMLGHDTLDGALRAGKEAHGRFARLARCLIKRKHEVFAIDMYGCTPLQCAAAIGNRDMVAALLEPFDLPADGKRVLEMGAPGHEYINHQDGQMCFSALHGAVAHSEHAVVVLLLQHGANPQVLDVTRKAAFKVAPSLVSLQELLRLMVHHHEDVPMSVIVQMMAEVLEQQMREGPAAHDKGGGAAPAAAAKEAAAKEAATKEAATAKEAAAKGAAKGQTASGAATTSGAAPSKPANPPSPDGKLRVKSNWFKAAKGTGFVDKVAAKMAGPSAQRFNFLSIAGEMVGAVQSADIGATIRRFFSRLYDKALYGTIVEYVVCAVEGNHYKLTEMMIDLICNQCPEVLKAAQWQATMEPLVSSFPTLFHRLLFKLQDMRDEDVRGFVRGLSPEGFQASAASQQTDHVDTRPAHHAMSTVLAAVTAIGHYNRPTTAASPAAAGGGRGGHAATAAGVGAAGGAAGEAAAAAAAQQGHDLGHGHGHGHALALALSPAAKAAVVAAGVAASALHRRTSMAATAWAAAAERPAGRPARKSGAADRVKLLIYQQLVEGLKKVTYRVIKIFFEEADERLLNDMAQFPIYADFVGLVADRQTAQAFDESDSTRKLLLELLRRAGGGGDVLQSYVPSGGALPKIPSNDARAVFSKLSGKFAFNSSAKVHSDNQGILMNGAGGGSGAGGGNLGSGRQPGYLGGSGRHPNSSLPVTATTPRLGDPSVRAGHAHGGGGSSNPGSGHHSDKTLSGAGGVGGGGMEGAAKLRERLELQTLNVEHVLWAAVRAGKAYNVEAAVTSIIGWVDTNSKDKKAVFLTGVTSDLIKELAIRFPSSCASLLNVVSRDVMERLDTLQVSARLMYGKDHLVKASHVRNPFTWRQHELMRLKAIRGYDDYVVDALVDYGVPFECVYKAAVELGSTVEEFAALIEKDFSGPDLKILISNGIRLVKIRHYINACAQPLPEGMSSDFAEKLEVPMSQLLREMLRAKLSPRIVDVILREGKMFETTKYNNFRPGRPLRKEYPEPLFVPAYTHHFVQLLLINWRKGNKDGKGNYTQEPWAKKYIDSVFEPNDPLYTKLKSAYDNKLTDTQVYIQGNTSADAAEADASARDLRRSNEVEQEAEERQRQQHMRRLMGVFVSNPLLVHRWPVYLMALLLLSVTGVWRTHWQRSKEKLRRWWKKRAGAAVVSRGKKAKSGTLDGAVLAFPILNFVNLGAGDILTALADADAPSSWFHYAVVRALYSLHWDMFGRVMIYLTAACQLLFACVFCAFFLIVLNHRTFTDSDEEDGGMLRRSPEVQATLIASAVLSGSMLLERVLESHVPVLGTWVQFGRQLELCYHGMVWAVAGLVWSGTAPTLVPALSGLAMLLFVSRLTLFGLVTEKLSTAVLALLEILADSRYFFLLIAAVYGGFVLAVAGLRGQAGKDASSYATQLFTTLLGDFQADSLTDERDVWRFPDMSLLLLSIYAVLMMIVFMNLLIATMNDTYDRVKEFREVEVMRLRAHMMVFVKDFMKRTEQMQDLDGDVLHLLLRPEEKKSERWLSQSGGNDPSEFGAWAGRIGYMRSTIVREVEGVVRQTADKATAQMEELSARMDKLATAVAALR